MDLKNIARLIAKKMSKKDSFSDSYFYECIKAYTNLSETEILEIKKLAKVIFEREYSQGMEM